MTWLGILFIGAVVALVTWPAPKILSPTEEVLMRNRPDEIGF